MIVEWSIPSVDDLDEIKEYIAKDNFDRAQSFIDELITFLITHFRRCAKQKSS
ncbi:MAG: hypothetical protein GX567_16605 [Clostridia bacterium]|nr:hypothetical protein [Clostridia bacterium]